MMAAPGGEDGEKLDLMVKLIQAYEAKSFPVDLPDPAEASSLRWSAKPYSIRFRTYNRLESRSHAPHPELRIIYIMLS